MSDLTIFKTILFFFLPIILSAQSVITKHDFIVARDGSGNFKSVQEAINAVPDLRKNRTVIFIRNGTYKEKLTLPPTKSNITFIGESVERTVLTYDDYAQKKNIFGEDIGTSGSSSFFIFGDGFTAENITFENSSGPVGQAVAVRVDGDQVSFKNCRFLGFQDTLYPHGEKSRQYYFNCYIEGTIDFIFGWSTAVFDSCTIFGKLGGYFTAASTLPETKYGFIFLNCKITGDAPADSFYLGRPWRPFAKTVFINCYLDKQVNPEGWHNWGKPDAEKTSFYAEYKNYGPHADVESRVIWSHQLTDEESKEFTIGNIFRDWIPFKQESKSGK
jgi:pectinesterase